MVDTVLDRLIINLILTAQMKQLTQILKESHPYQVQISQLTVNNNSVLNSTM